MGERRGRLELGPRGEWALATMKLFGRPLGERAGEREAKSKLFASSGADCAARPRATNAEMMNRRVGEASQLASQRHYVPKSIDYFCVSLFVSCFGLAQARAQLAARRAPFNSAAFSLIKSGLRSLARPTFSQVGPAGRPAEGAKEAQTSGPGLCLGPSESHLTRGRAQAARVVTSQSSVRRARGHAERPRSSARPLPPFARRPIEVEPKNKLKWQR